MSDAQINTGHTNWLDQIPENCLRPGLHYAGGCNCWEPELFKCSECGAEFTSYTMYHGHVWRHGVT